MIPARVLQELGAEIRTFRTVKGAMLWYRDQLAQRLRVTKGHEFGSFCVSSEKRNQTNATFAAIARCLKDVQHVAWLVAWYETTYGDGIWLSERANMSRWAFTRRCRRTERDLRERMQNARLLTEPS